MSKKKPYYALSVGGRYIKIHYVRQQEEYIDPSPDIAVAWIEEKDTRMHYFLFQLGKVTKNIGYMLIFVGDSSYVLSGKHSSLNGLKTTLIKVNRPVTINNYRNVPRWRNNTPRIGGDVCCLLIYYKILFDSSFRSLMMSMCTGKHL